MHDPGVEFRNGARRRRLRIAMQRLPWQNTLILYFRKESLADLQMIEGKQGGLPK